MGSGLMVSLIFKQFFILSFIAISLYGEVYVLSYKVVVKSNLVTSDSLYISNLMVPSKRFKSINFIELEGNRRDSDSFVLQKNRDKILGTLFKNGVVVEDNTKAINQHSKSLTTIILPPIYVSLERSNLDINLIILKEIN